jgi:hypothetical protein
MNYQKSCEFPFFPNVPHTAYFGCTFNHSTITNHDVIPNNSTYTCNNAFVPCERENNEQSNVSRIITVCGEVSHCACSSCRAFHLKKNVAYGDADVIDQSKANPNSVLRFSDRLEDNLSLQIKFCEYESNFLQKEIKTLEGSLAHFKTMLDSSGNFNTGLVDLEKEIETLEETITENKNTLDKRTEFLEKFREILNK